MYRSRLRLYLYICAHFCYLLARYVRSVVLYASNISDTIKVPVPNWKFEIQRRDSRFDQSWQRITTYRVCVTCSLHSLDLSVYTMRIPLAQDVLAPNLEVVYQNGLLVYNWEREREWCTEQDKDDACDRSSVLFSFDSIITNSTFYSEYHLLDQCVCVCTWLWFHYFSRVI